MNSETTKARIAKLHTQIAAETDPEKREDQKKRLAEDQEALRKLYETIGVTWVDDLA